MQSLSLMLIIFQPTLFYKHFQYSKFKTVFNGTGCPKGCREGEGAPNRSLGEGVLLSQLGLQILTLLKRKTVHLAPY